MSTSSLSKQLWAKFNEQAKKELHLCERQFWVHSFIPKNFVTKTIISVGESLVGYWDSLIKDNWASLNARVLRPSFRQGTIREGFKRRWIAPAPAGSEIQVVIKKRIASKSFPGKLGGTITAEKYNNDGAIIETKRVVFADGKYESTKTITMSGEKFGFLIVTVDTPLKPGKSFAYSIRYKERIIKKTYKKVKGFADLHTHLAAEYAYAGNWLHGKNVGSQSSALGKCSTSNHKNKGLKKTVIKDINKGALDDPSASIVVESGEGFPTFANWPHHLDIAHQQMHEDWVKNAFKRGMKVLVACAVNSEMLSILLAGPIDKDRWRDMHNLKLQIEKIHDFCDRNHKWVEIAYNPWHAREIINNNKLAIVLAIEASNIFPPDQGDYISQLDQMYCMGVRKVIMVHHVDNRFAGAAPQERQLTTAQTLGAVSRASLLSNNSIRDNKIFPYFRPGDGDKFLGFDLDNTGKSKRGLSTSGVRLVNAMMDRHMLIDVSHNSAQTFDDVFDISRRRKYYPLIASHTKFKQILGDDEQDVQREFVTTDDQIRKINRTGGIVGLRTAPWSDQKSCCGNIVHVDPDAPGEVGTARNFAQQVAYAYKMNIDFAFGTDMNGFTNHIGPNKSKRAKPKTVSSDYWRNGLRHQGLLPDLVNDLISLGTPGASMFNQSAEKILNTWQRCWNTNRVEVRKEPRNLSSVSVKGIGYVRRR